jgi:hypothetical protein
VIGGTARDENRSRCSSGQFVVSSI